MSYLKPNTAGVYDIGSANIDTLYVRGKKFQDYITELVFEDQLEQSEIDEVKTLLQYLNTSGLSSEWIVDNNNKNQDLRTAINDLQTKLANIDTSALTESSVLTNDNRNSVLKTALDTATSDLTALTSRVTTAEGDIDNLETRMTTAEGDIDNLETRMTTAEGDIDGVETKTRFIVGASVTGTGDNTFSSYSTRVGPADGVEKGSALIELNMKNGPANELIGYTIKSNFNNIDDLNENESIYSHRDGRLTLLAKYMRLQAAQQIRIGNFAEYGDGFSAMAINIGGRGNKINIGRIDSQNATGELTEINLGVLGGATERNTNTSIDGNVYLAGARFDDLDTSTPFNLASLIALMSSGPPSWVVGFFSGATTFPYSDVWCMKGGFAGNKDGDVETRNSIMLEELYVVNKSVLNITPKVGFFLAKADYSCTQLIGDHRTQVFEGKIVLRNNNITSSSVDWAFTDADDKCNVVNIGGDDGILIHQGASDDGAPLRIINSCNGSVKISIHDDGTHGYPYPGLEVKPYHFENGDFSSMVRIGFYPAQNQGNGLSGSYQLEVNQENNRDGIAVIFTDIFGNAGGNKVNKINANSINTPGTITGIDVVGSTSISAPTATAGSLVINANYTGNTDARLYKNADNKLMWNGAEVGAGGVSSGGITYMINVASNITNPAPSPTETIMTAAYSGNPQRTITQAITSNSAFYIAKYTTEVFDEASNPVLTGLQQLNQYISWNSQNQVGQLYGQLWFQATAIGFGVLYQRTYASPVTTTPATELIGTPIPTPKGLYNIKFQRVVFPNINVVVTSGNPVVLRYRVEGYDFLNEWTTLTSMVGLAPEVSSTTNNLTITLDESKILNQTSSVGGKTAVRLVLYIASGTGTISQTSAGGEDLAAYSLIGLGVNTPALFRTMLYDGTAAKITIPHSTTPTLVEYDLAIDAPYNVSAFPLPTLSTDLYFIQPSGGGHGTNAITLYFNEGTISHYHSTIAAQTTTPTLAQVLNSGATASQDINMNSHKISGITTLEGAANGNWNVKEITTAEGSGISVTPTNGSYAIANSGILSVAAAEGTPGITATTTNGAVILQNSGIISISPGAGISVNTSESGVATITNTGIGAASVLDNIRDEHQSLYEVGALPRKPDYWARNWSVADSQVRSHRDMYVSVDGKIIASATGLENTAIRYSTNYGADWNDGNVSFQNFQWLSICGTSNGSKLFAFARDGSFQTGYALRLYSSTNQGATWTQITSSAFEFDNAAGITTINRVRCSGDGKYILANISNVGINGRILFSSDGGATWVVKNISANLPAGFTNGVAMSRSGAVQFLTWISNTGTTNSGVFRSIDYGATWTQTYGHIAEANWTHIECDATGRFVWATRYANINTQDSQAYRSENYGYYWVPAGMNSIEDIWVSGTGQFIAGVSVPNTAVIDGQQNSRFVVYSVDYGRTIQIYSLGNTTTFRTINGSADGSVLVVGSVDSAEGNPSYSGDGKIRIAREGQQNIQDLQVTGAGTLSKANGIYSLNITSAVAAEQLWYSGINNITTNSNTFYLDDFRAIAGKIDLNQYDLRYEIDINWDYSQSGYPYTFISLGLNSVQASVVQNPTQNNAQTRWHNLIQPTFGSTSTADQLYTSRFYCGYSAGHGAGTTFRYRQTLHGKISLQTRTNQQTTNGVTNDIAMNSRLITNDFVSNAVTLEQINTNQFRLFAGDSLDAGQQTIRGYAAWDAACDNLWNLGSAGSNDLNSGVYRLYLYLTDGATTNRFRAAELKYSIYRVNKGVPFSV
jgi:hypothetical protein